MRLSYIANSCKEIAESAGALLLKTLDSDLNGHLKTDRSFVSNADIEIDSHIIGLINERFPDDSIVSEESGLHKGTSNYTWYLDPVDGSTNLLYGIPLYGCIVTVTKKNTAVAAAMHLPKLDMLFWCERGKGLYLNNSILRVDETSGDMLNQATALIETAGSPEIKKRAHEFMYQNLHSFRSFRRYGTYAAFLIALASSQLFVGIHFQEDQIYEILGIKLMFEEAGFDVVNTENKAWDNSDSSDIIYSPPQLTDEVCKLFNNQ